MADIDNIFYTIMLYAILIVFGVIVFVIYLITAVNRIPVIGWFVPDLFGSPEASSSLYNYKFSQIIEKPFHAALFLTDMSIDGRTFIEHSAESSYYGSLAKSGSELLDDNDGLLRLFMLAYKMPFKIELGGIFSVSDNVKKANVGVYIPVMYKDKKWDVMVNVNG